MTTATVRPPQPPQARGQRKIRFGRVISNKMQKTIVVRVTQLVRHPTYHRVIKQSNSFKVHDETNRAAIGDWVKIMETRPLSKDKRWRLVDIIERASSAPPVPDEAPAVAKQPSGSARPRPKPMREGETAQ
jgi:small subunit ribosomal protein S17